MIGEENSTQEKGRISSQDIPAGTKVEQYTTIKYHISKGQQEITIPELSGQTGVDAQQTLEDMGLTVTVQKEYSEADDSDSGSVWPLVEPGYVMSVSPEAGTSMTSGDSVTLTVSRGLDHGDTAQIPNVVGMTKNEALTALGKWVDIQVTEQQSTEVPAGQVISQDPSAVSEDDDVAYGDPDEPMAIVVSCGDQAPADTTAADAITFPYTLDITGVPGVSEGTLYVSELINGNFQQLGSYPLTFKKAE